MRLEEEEERFGRKTESSRVNFEECILNDKKRKEELQECRGVRQWRTRVDKVLKEEGFEERRHEGNIENGVESMVTDNGGDAGTGLQECRGSLIGTRIWNTSGKQ